MAFFILKVTLTGLPVQYSGTRMDITVRLSGSCHWWSVLCLMVVQEPLSNDKGKRYKTYSISYHIKIKIETQSAIMNSIG